MHCVANFAHGMHVHAPRAISSQDGSLGHRLVSCHCTCCGLLEVHLVIGTLGLPLNCRICLKQFSRENRGETPPKINAEIRLTAIVGYVLYTKQQKLRAAYVASAYRMNISDLVINEMNFANYFATSAMQIQLSAFIYLESATSLA